MNKVQRLLKVKVPFCLALLLIVIAATGAELIILSAAKADSRAASDLATVSLAPERDWRLLADGKVALNGADIPLLAEAKRLTFDSSNNARYRVNFSAATVADFYRQALNAAGWSSVAASQANPRAGKLAISYAQNPISKKTDITFNFIPANAEVLGVKIAEAVPPSSPAPQSEPAQPLRPEQPAQPMMPQPSMPLEPPLAPNQMNFIKPGPTEQQNQTSQEPAATCRQGEINLPGPCSLYDNIGNTISQQPNRPAQPGQPGQQPGQMMNQQWQGSSEQDRQKMDEQRFKDMKRGISQFTKGITMTKKAFARVKTSVAKCGVGLPEDLNSALSQANELINKINSAKTADELDEITGDIQDVGSAIQDWGPKMGDLNRLCQMFKQADRNIQQFERNLKRVTAQAKNNKKIDVSELLTQYRAAVTAQKDILTQAKELAKTDPESALTKIEDEFYGNLDSLGNFDMQINAVLNISRGLVNINRELKTFAAQIKALAKKKVDVTELNDMLKSLTEQAAELKSLVAAKADPEELIAKVEEAFDTRQQLQDALQELGVNDLLPQFKASDNYNVKVNIPDAFRKDQPEGMDENNSMDNGL